MSCRASEIHLPRSDEYKKELMVILFKYRLQHLNLK